MSIPGLDSHKIYPNLIDRLAFSRDASVYRLVPESVLRPENENDVIAILRHAFQEKIPVTFRTGGTSLSGQAVGSGYIVEVIRGWHELSVLENGNSIKVQPGLTGAYVNGILKKYGRKIGPDPASIKAARIGGIVANNASGMACGIAGNSYHTVKSIRFILPNGNIYDTSNPGDFQKFHTVEKALYDGLLSLRKEILDSEGLTKIIRRKYRLKNTIGYSMNSFLDHDDPMEIFARLLIGSEGTLAFISNVTFKTLPDPDHKWTDLFIFNNPANACSTIPELKDLEPSSIELMDKASLDTSRYLKNFNLDLDSPGLDAAALLMEFQADNQGSITKPADEALKVVNSAGGKALLGWQTDEVVRNQLWALRKGLYPTVGSFRKPGTSVITEDLCFDISDLGNAVAELQNIFIKNNTQDAVVFGHAQDGNLHFVASTDLNDKNASNNFGILMKDLVDMTIGQFDGSLKGEHGTGRNMAPFVELEWGTDLYRIMQKVKRLADPEGILNQGVILNGGNQKIHVENLKKLPLVEKNVDLCIECGFCETVCPSRELTLTPRQRIIIRRELKNSTELTREQEREIRNDFNYKGLDTCAVDGLCEEACPVNINTGEMVIKLREGKKSRFKKLVATLILRNFSIVSSTVRVALAYAGFVKGSDTLIRKINRITRILPFRMPEIDRYLPGPSAKLPKTEIIGATIDLIYYPSCLTRTMSPGTGNQNLATVILEIGKLSGKIIHIPDAVEGTCCGMPFHSKGYSETYKSSLTATVDLLIVASDSGRIPVIVDTSPCTNQLRHGNEILDGDSLKRWKSLKFIDITEFLWETVRKTSQTKLDYTIAVHPTCSTDRMGLSKTMQLVAAKIARKAEISPDWNCCGFAGDRGIWYPELTGSASSYESEDIGKGEYNFGVSSSRTCEYGMEKGSGIEFRPLAGVVLEYLRQDGE